ncbi:hypothetical protein BCU68_03835 [Vibrio sp. 10N.286.49.B3]|uniref:copper chaperone PCu(A)C n=1 Tax=Vibrio sp. 10N.286.49.B3 TaxID=1880855 RepID=UPI000C863638|nr:copper chaperone PCu(A)C [Vibrio sp. 10N.286.49.B3]PMH43129.1 hypothetical protein BCU68_03835 [Vibrio sp. 10N.286.49.B3]
MLLKTLFITTLTLSSFCQASSNITIGSPYIRATPPTAINSAIFAKLSNSSNVERRLIGAKTPIAGTVELHDVIHDGDIMKMRQIEDMLIPANSTLHLQPGGLHIMLFDLQAPLTEGSTTQLTLLFANGETQTLEVPVKKVMHGMQHQH